MKTITFVIPVYNEEKRIQKTFEALQELQLPRGLKLAEIIFVNDGSTDRSEFQISNFKFQIEKATGAKLTLISYEKNRGKGYAVKTGMLTSTTDYTLFFDADMSTPLCELEKFAPYITKDADVIIGTRKNGQSTVIKHQPLVREFLGRGFTLTTRLLLGLSVTDFTCGFKAFSKKAVNSIFPNSIINRWAYDAEILLLAQKQNLSIVEKSVVWANDEDTKVIMQNVIGETMRDLILILFRHNLLPFLKILAKTTKLEYGYRIATSFLL